jgi:DNA-directed RNA polymerase beta' subunit
MKTDEKSKIITVTEIDTTSETAPFIIFEMQYSNLEEKIDALEAEKKELKKKILAKFEEVYGHQSQSIKNNLTGNTLQRIISVTKSIDEDAVKKIVSPEIWNKVTTQKIVPDLFFAAIQMGDIVAREVAPAIETKEIDKLAVKAFKVKK